MSGYVKEKTYVTSPLLPDLEDVILLEPLI